MRAQGGLPAGAVVIEREAIPASAHTERELVLWMISSEKHDRGSYSEKNPYMCPERTRGSYFSGPTRISLVDTGSGKTINTVVLRSSVDEADTFDVPYRILADWPYLVPGTPKDAEGKPHLLALRDLNGDGLALETAFFEAIACMGLPSTLIGSSPRQDKVIQYQVELKLRSPSGR